MYDLPNIKCIFGAKCLSSGNQSLLTNYHQLDTVCRVNKLFSPGATFEKTAFSG